MTGFRWEKFEAWRNHPLLNAKLIDYFPGIRIAVGVFAVYVVYDKVFKKTPEHKH